MSSLRCSERFCAPTPSTTNPAASALRFALVAFVCNGTSYGGPLAHQHLARALRFRRHLRKLGSTLPTLAITHGYDATSLRALRRAGWDEMLVARAPTRARTHPREPSVSTCQTSSRTGACFTPLRSSCVCVPCDAGTAWTSASTSTPPGSCGPSVPSRPPKRGSTGRECSGTRACCRYT